VLIQTHSPTFATDTKQSTIVDATADATFHAIRHADFSLSGLVLVLAALRELPDRVVRAARRQPRRWRAAPTIAALIEASYWIVVDEIPRRELLLGSRCGTRRLSAAG
jgi:hypothetical protein